MFGQNFKETYSRKTVPNFIGTNSTPRKRYLQSFCSHALCNISMGYASGSKKLRRYPRNHKSGHFLVRTITLRRCRMNGEALYPHGMYLQFRFLMLKHVGCQALGCFNLGILYLCTAHPSDAVTSAKWLQ